MKGSARGQPKERRETKPRTAAPVSFRSFGSPSHPWKQSNVNQSNQSKLKTRNSPDPITVYPVYSVYLVYCGLVFIFLL